MRALYSFIRSFARESVYNKYQTLCSLSLFFHCIKYLTFFFISRLLINLSISYNEFLAINFILDSFSSTNNEENKTR